MNNNYDSDEDSYYDSDEDSYDEDDNYRSPDKSYFNKLIDDDGISQNIIEQSKRENNINPTDVKGAHVYNNDDGILQRVIQESLMETSLYQNNEMQRIIELSKKEFSTNNSSSDTNNSLSDTHKILPPKPPDSNNIIKKYDDDSDNESIESVETVRSVRSVENIENVETVEKVETVETFKNVKIIKNVENNVKNVEIFENDKILERTNKTKKFTEYIARMVALNDAPSILINSFTNEKIAKFLNNEINNIGLLKCEYDLFAKYLLEINNVKVDPGEKLYLISIIDVND